jgi:hypothetical protein
LEWATGQGAGFDDGSVGRDSERHKEDRMLLAIFLVFAAMFGISGIFISIEAKQRRDNHSSGAGLRGR